MYKPLFTLVLLLETTITPAQSPATGKILGHDYVDLGLSVMWATCNIGANLPSDYGDYFAWGEAETKSSYTDSNSATYNKSLYIFLDAATMHWGSVWRMPTKDEIQELIDNCTWTWTTQGGHEGYRVTSKKNGNSIFLSAAGYYDTQLNVADRWGCYWFSSPYESEDSHAFCLNFGRGGYDADWNYRYLGESIRHVIDK